MDLGLKGRHAIVTASTSGLGLATARMLSREGANVVLSGRRGDMARDEAQKLPSAIGLEADLTQPDDIERLIRDATTHFGPIEILILNSGGPAIGAAQDITPADLEQANSLILYPMQRLLLEVLPGMRERGWGRVVAFGSSGIDQPLANLALSNSARAALAGLLKTLAAEVASDGVTVNMLLPGRVATPRVAQIDGDRARREGRDVSEIQAESMRSIPIGRYGTPDEFAATVAFLCSEPASYITGIRLRVDGGMVGSH